MPKLFLLLFVSALALISCKSEESDPENALVGTWDFETFESADSIPLDEAYREESNLNAKGLVYRFMSDGRCSVTHPAGNKEDNFSGEYRYYPKNRNLVIDEGNLLTGHTIVQLNKTTLKVVPRKTQLIMIFKRRTS